MFPLLTGSHILGTVSTQVCELFLLLVCLGLVFPLFSQDFPSSVTEHCVFLLIQPLCLFCKVIISPAVTGWCRRSSTPAEQNPLPSCAQPGITWLERVCMNWNAFITLSHWSLIFVCKALIRNQVWPKAEHVFGEGVSRQCRKEILSALLSSVGEFYRGFVSTIQSTGWGNEAWARALWNPCETTLNYSILFSLKSGRCWHLFQQKQLHGFDISHVFFLKIKA